MANWRQCPELLSIGPNIRQLRQFHLVTCRSNKYFCNHRAQSGDIGINKVDVTCLRPTDYNQCLLYRKKC